MFKIKTLILSAALALFGFAAKAQAASGVSNVAVVISTQLPNGTTGYQITSGVIYFRIAGSTVATFATTGGSLKGTTTNDSPNTGFVGEVISSGTTVLSSQSGTGNYDNIVSTGLAAGDYVITGTCVYSESGLTVTRHLCVVSAFSGATTTDQIVGDNEMPGSINTGNSNASAAVVPAWRVSLAVPTTIYLKSRSDYTGTAPTMKGFLKARRGR